MVHHKRTSCRACDSESLLPFLSLGPMPLANSFLKMPEEFASEAFFPLDVYFCNDCSLVQLLDVIDPEVLFRNYIYVTGTSDTIAAHNVEYARTVAQTLDLDPGRLVVEVASNDGSLLKCFRKLGSRVLGIEPAENIAEMARARGIETLTQFFNASVAKQVRSSHGAAKAVIGNNVLAHVDHTQDFLQGCRDLLDYDGLMVIEVPYLKELLDRMEYDTIYHEHLCYFSVNTLMRLCDDLGLSVVRVDRVPVHGGSLRMYSGSVEHYGSHCADAVAMAQWERSQGLTDFQIYENLAGRVEGNRRALLDLLQGLRERGNTVAGYGAPAKGNTLLNYCGIDTSLVHYTVDKSPLKVGRYTPGAHLPVLETSTLLERQPDYVMILAWNFADEIMAQQQEYRDRGGKFIIPIPEPVVV